MQPKNTTILDVAKAAEVSTATVSNAFNSTGRVTAKTRERVLAIARQLKYYPNRHARILASGSSRSNIKINNRRATASESQRALLSTS